MARCLGDLQPAETAEAIEIEVSMMLGLFSAVSNLTGLDGTDFNHSGNRFRPLEEDVIFEGITELRVEQTLLTWDEVCGLLTISHCLISTNASNRFLR